MNDSFHVSAELVEHTVPAFTAICAAARLTIPRIPHFAEQATTQLMQLADQQGIVINGPGVFIYTSDGIGEAGEFLMQVALPVLLTSRFESPDASLAQLEIAALRCAQLSFKGPADLIGEAYPILKERIDERGLRAGNQSREVFREWSAYDADDNIIDIQIEVL